MKISVLVVAVIGGVAAGLLIAWLTQSDAVKPLEGPESDAFAKIGDRRPEFVHAGVNGELWRASDFDGRAMLVNFWATWCAPCVREMPLLQATTEKYPEQLRVVGIAVDEPGAVDAFVEQLGISYPILIGTSDVRETRRRYGNPDGMLPYSVLVDAHGIIRWRHLGELDEPMLEKALEPLVHTAEEQ